MYFSDYNDFTNAFKIYNSKKIKKLDLNLSTSFEIFLELPLKFINKKGAIIRSLLFPEAKKKIYQNSKIKELWIKIFKSLNLLFIE